MKDSGVPPQSDLSSEGSWVPWEPSLLCLHKPLPSLSNEPLHVTPWTPTQQCFLRASAVLIGSASLCWKPFKIMHNFFSLCLGKSRCLANIYWWMCWGWGIVMQFNNRGRINMKEFYRNTNKEKYFWLGDWDWTSQHDTQSGPVVERITRQIEGCMEVWWLVESSSAGHTVKSLHDLKSKLTIFNHLKCLGWSLWY